jgi:hypothetical protein
VVRRVLGLLERGQPSSPRPRLVEPYTDFITETLGHYPTLRATRLYDMLRERGYTGSVRGLREYVAQVRPRPSVTAQRRWGKSARDRTDWMMERGLGRGALHHPAGSGQRLTAEVGGAEEGGAETA